MLFKPVQNVIVEINYKLPQASNLSSSSKEASPQISVYVGWTGMPSKRKPAPIVSRDGISGTRGNASAREQEVFLVEIDATFAHTLGLSDGQKVVASLHVDPPLAHTINIEPLTPADWEIIELHATFLELNLQSQIRALPNPGYSPANGLAHLTHPLTLHLSPTSTANIIVTSFTPPSSSPFAKLAPEAEVIVAPKMRAASSRGSVRENRSVTSTSRRSAGARSGASTVRHKSSKDEDTRPPMLFRALDRSNCNTWFEAKSNPKSRELVAWLDRDILQSKAIRNGSWICLTLIQPAGLDTHTDPQRQQQELEASSEAGKPTLKIVARLEAWDDPPDSRHIALSLALCESLGCPGIVGGVVKVELAPHQAPKSSIQKLKIYPFLPTSNKQTDALKFGGESKAEREDIARHVMSIYGKQPSDNGLLNGPLTDGLLLSRPANSNGYSNWAGGLVRFEYPLITGDTDKQTWSWINATEKSLPIEVKAAIPRPVSLGTTMIRYPLPEYCPKLVAIDTLVTQLESHLSHMSSVLLTGALGSGKTSVAQLLAHLLRDNFLFHVTYFSCRQLVNEATRIATTKDALSHIFMDAAWGARLGGRSLVVLDDLDKLCPAETELEVGNENGRNRQISEAVCSIIRQYSGKESGIVLLATALDKESLHNVIIGGHVVREIIGLKAPDKEGRRRIMEMVIGLKVASAQTPLATLDSRPCTADNSGSDDENLGWMDGSSTVTRRKSLRNSEGFVVARDVDFLDISGQTDGYMPGDLILLVSRARNEALIRSASQTPDLPENSAVQLSRLDFDKALKGLMPASLRNVTLQTSTTTFDSIGGLQETRKVLLETLQYPTTYAPIFAQCPLRLRSGLLLYGYPGCGKTLLASAVAGECGLNFISVKGPEILNKYIGASEKSVRDLFERAEAARPCVLFFDEFDSIAPKRGHDSTGVTDRVVNQLLTQMDGAEGLSGVYVLAATSRPDLIDPALLRPGRLDKSLLCGLPNFEDRIDILRALGKKLKLSEEVQNGPEGGLHAIATRTDGYSGADLQALVYNAHLEAIHDVLRDQDHSETGKKRTVPKSSGKVNATARDFVQFRFGEEEDRAESEARGKEGYNRSRQIAEQAAVMAKLEGIKIAKKRQKLAQREGSDKDNAAQKEKEGQQEVTIQWKHIMKSLATTRASISLDERQRLERIYREFVVGRNGEMPNGQGPTEVGGRSSLM
jgi:peroxin-1